VAAELVVSLDGPAGSLRSTPEPPSCWEEVKPESKIEILGRSRDLSA
jgi:hypothetical protein